MATVRSFARYRQRNGLLDIDGDIVLDRACGQARPDPQHPAGEARAAVGTTRRRAARAHAGAAAAPTAARADKVLRLNVEDLDVAGKRVRTRSKGGDTDWLFFGSAIAFVSGAARACERLGDTRVVSVAVVPGAQLNCMAY